MQTSLDHHNSSAAASARVRELARRRSGADDVFVVWHPDGDRIELSVLDATTGEGFHLEVEPDRALDAFTTHSRTSPGARAPARDSSRLQAAPTTPAHDVRAGLGRRTPRPCATSQRPASTTCVSQSAAAATSIPTTSVQ
jgi:hypothetical protein